jgi:hypothetical protein
VKVFEVRQAIDLAVLLTSDQCCSQLLLWPLCRIVGVVLSSAGAGAVSAVEAGIGVLPEEEAAVASGRAGSGGGAADAVDPIP